MALSSRSVVLKDPPPDQRLVADIDALVRPWHKEMNLFFLYDGVVDRGSGIRVHSWWDAARPGLEVTLVCDDVARVRYISVTAETAEHAPVQRAMLERIAARFPTFSVAELREAVRRAPGDSGAWTRLGLALDGDEDAESFELMTTALRSPDPDARRGAATAAALVQWPTLVPALTAAISAEPEGDVKELLRLAATACGHEAS